MKEIVIIGAGDFGQEVTWLIEEINKGNLAYHILGYLDDDPVKIGQEINGYQVLGKISDLMTWSRKNSICAVIAMQDGNVRKQIVERFPAFENWETLIHPSANISDTATIGCGCIICSGVSVSLNTSIGEHCLVNVSVAIAHDCVIENYVSIMPCACICGHAKIRENAYLSANSTVIPKIKIGVGSKVGAGSVAIQNIKDGCSVMGVPAKEIRF